MIRATWLSAFVCVACLGTVLLAAREDTPAGARDAAPSWYVRQATPLATWTASTKAYRDGPGQVQAGPWYYAGPFTPAPGQGDDVAFGPEKGVDLKAVYPQAEGKPIGWQADGKLQDGRRSSLRLPRNARPGAVYLYRVIISPAELTCPATLSCPNAVTVWLGGKKLLAEAGSPAEPRRKRTPAKGHELTLPLKKGANGLLVRFGSGGRGVSFQFDLGSADPQTMLLERIAKDFRGADLSGLSAIEARGAEVGREYEALRADIANRRWFDKIASQVQHPAALILPEDRDPLDVVLRRTAALLADIRQRKDAPDLTTAAGELASLAARSKAADAAGAGSRYDLFVAARALRRKIALANPLVASVREILFVKRNLGPGHICDQYFGSHQRPGGGLYVLSDPAGAAPGVRDVLADSVVQSGRLKGQKLTGGSFMAPELSFDGKTILFAYTQLADSKERWSPEKCFHVFRVGADGKGLVQLTDGPWNDFDPCWLPSGRIAFISERRGGFGRCHPRPVPTYTLFSMNPDGSDIVPLSYHETNEWNPSVNHDGMIVYSRWDYVDRGDCIAHHPWITTPDGRDPRAIQGNYPVSRSARPDAELALRAVPGSRKLMATAAPHHGQAMGAIILVDPDRPDDGAMGPVRRVTPELPFPESEGGKSRLYGTPWPLSETYFLCVYAPPAPRRGRQGTHGIYLVDAFGNRELLYRDSRIGCSSPIPLRPRPRPPVIPHLTDVGLPPALAKAGSPGHKPSTTGVIACVNVYDGRLPWPKDTKIKALRIVQLFPKATYRIDRPRIGIGAESLARGVLGTVPVEEDGSVNFVAPAGKPIYFQALDAAGRAVQSMESLTYVHAGERLTCQGCHERKRPAPASPPVPPAALRRAPSRIRPEVDGAFPVSYPRLVQPVLVRACVPCHEAKRKEKKKAPDLSTALGSYKVLGRLAYSLSGKPPSRPTVRTVPGQFGARASKLYQMLAKGHNDVKLSPEDLHRIVLWLDTNSNFYGAYHDLDKQQRGELVMPSIE